MAAPIQKLAQLSSKIFGMSSPYAATKEQMKPLICAMNQMTAADVYFDANEVIEKDMATKSKRFSELAPVTYMHIHQDDMYTMAVFVVKSGKFLPLHDHPRMHGLLKVIHGSVKIKSYSEIDQQPLPVSASQIQTQLKLRKRPVNVKTVIRHEDVILTEKDNCCALTPSASNIHEIHAETEIAAFLDILAPPYENDNSCHYYQEVPCASTSDTRWLIEIPQPLSYWCDTIKYKGPPLL